MPIRHARFARDARDVSLMSVALFLIRMFHRRDAEIAEVIRRKDSYAFLDRLRHTDCLSLPRVGDFA